MNLTAAIVDADLQPLTAWAEVDFYLCRDGHLHQRADTQATMTCMKTGAGVFLRLLDLETPADDCEVTRMPITPTPMVRGMTVLHLQDLQVDLPTPKAAP